MNVECFDFSKFRHSLELLSAFLFSKRQSPRNRVHLLCVWYLAVILHNRYIRVGISMKGFYV